MCDLKAKDIVNIQQTEDTICAIATAQGGAIGTIRVSGAQAIAITDRILLQYQENL